MTREPDESPNEGAWAVLTAVREIQLATAEAFERAKRENSSEGAAASASVPWQGLWTRNGSRRSVPGDCPPRFSDTSVERGEWKK